ncbi:low molecular weight phosphatase family protein [Amnibacterium endophyticum]|uniref:Low molecular weight phosphatase family protein n=1 Tax=Amnibacterium endophyticum TaxID=2109337 RepID=A0ABW4L9J0_9MICO
MEPNGRLLVVCTANVCRSPLAQRVLGLRLGGGVAVSSAGVRALSGSPMCAVSALELPDGADPTHAARQVEGDDVRAADLVVAMEREQRGALVREAPGTQASVFTLREAAALAGALAERGERYPDLAAVARAMHGQRGLVAVPADPVPPRRWWQRAVPPEDPLTIVDGHGAPEPQHRAAAARVRAVSEDLAAALGALLAPR